MGALWVFAGLCVAGLVGWVIAHPVRSLLAEMERRRNADNARILAIHRDAGNKWYPHVMADGRVRWYRVAHDHAVDL